MAEEFHPALLIGGEAVDGLGELDEIEAEQVEGALGFCELAFKALTLSVMPGRAEVWVAPVSKHVEVRGSPERDISSLHAG